MLIQVLLLAQCWSIFKIVECTQWIPPLHGVLAYFGLEFIREDDSWPKIWKLLPEHVLVHS